MEGDLHHLNGGLSQLQGDGMPHGYPMVPGPDGLPNLASDQGQMQRPNSVNRIDAQGGQDRQGVPQAVMTSAPGRPGFEQYGNNVPGAMPNQQMQGYSMPTNQNGMPMYPGGTNSNQQVDWSQVFPTGAHDSYVNAFPPNVGQTQIPVKQEHNVENGRADGVPGVDPTDSLFLMNQLATSTHNPYVLLSNQILSYFQSTNSAFKNQDEQHLLEDFFKPDNVKDFLDKYTNYNIHFPLIHVPSIHVTEMNNGLLAGLCCIGACYSSRVSPDHVREAMASVQRVFETQCRQLADWRQGSLPTTVSKADCDEIQAIILISVVHIWHGTPEQRKWGQNNLALLAGVARSSSLLRIAPESGLYSPLHQKGFAPQNFDVSRFDWSAWIEQERRIRIVHIILYDAALSMYFNMSSKLNPLEVDIPLPCDDAAWEARTAFDCAAALGLYGPETARQRNMDGTHRAKQPEASLALQALLHGSYQIQPGRTNLYGKFILIHGIIVLIRNALVDQNAAAAMKDLGTPPMHDWMVKGGESGNSSGRSTPVDGVAQQLPPQTRQAFSTALDKFKANWDADMATQFPPSMQVKSPRRYGFSRDAIHFYWLAKYMLKHTRPSDLQLPPDARVSQMMRLLRSVKKWVMTDGASRGEALGSVGDINDDYAVSEGTFNLAQLFAPLPNLVNDPRTPSVKTELDTGIL
jgi:hypothetical protein